MLNFLNRSAQEGALVQEAGYQVQMNNKVTIYSI